MTAPQIVRQVESQRLTATRCFLDVQPDRTTTFLHGHKPYVNVS